MTKQNDQGVAIAIAAPFKKNDYLLVGATTFMVWVMLLAASCKPVNSRQQQTMSAKADSAAPAHDSLESQVNAARLQVDQLTTKTVYLDSQIHNRDSAISKLQAERGLLQKKNHSLEHSLRKDKKKIAALKKEMDDKDKEYAAQLGILQSDKDNLTQQLGDLKTRYSKMKELGSVLHASNISLEAIHVKKNGGREKETRRARRANILRVHYDIDVNRIAEEGDKQLYFVIDAPGGKTLSDADHSGTITTNKGNTITYSFAKNVYLKQDEPINGLEADWAQSEDREKGKYIITIYNGGFKIGASNVELK